MTVRNGGAVTLNGYAQFDFSALPDAPTVDKAVLRLFVAVVGTPGTIEREHRPHSLLEETDVTP